MIVVEEDQNSRYVDYTNATSFESFTAKLEDIFHKWGISEKCTIANSAIPANCNNTNKGCVPIGGRVRNVRISLSDGNFHSQQEHPIEPTQDGFPQQSTEKKTESHHHYFISLIQLEQHEKRDENGQYTHPHQQAGKTIQWGQDHLQHFTPTMLSLMSSKFDFIHINSDYNESKSSSEFSLFSSKANPSVLDYYHKFNTISDIPSSEEDTANRVFVFTQEEKKRLAGIERFSQWFGVSDFLILSQQPVYFPCSCGAKFTNSHCVNNVHAESELVGVEPGTEAVWFLSALGIALGNANCTLPAFLAIDKSKSNIYNTHSYESHSAICEKVGTYMGCNVPGTIGNVAIRFETDIVPELGTNQSCVSGLVDFFRLKLQLGKFDQCNFYDDLLENSDFQTGIWASVCFTYKLSPSALEFKNPRVFNEEAYLSLNQIKLLQKLSHVGIASAASTNSCSSKSSATSGSENEGETEDCVASDITDGRKNESTKNELRYALGDYDLELQVVWPHLREGSYVDSKFHSTLNPCQSSVVNDKEDEYSSLPEYYIRLLKKVKVLQEASTNGCWSKRLETLIRAYKQAKELPPHMTVSEVAPPPPPSPLPITPKAIRKKDFVGKDNEDITSGDTINSQSNADTSLSNNSVSRSSLLKSLMGGILGMSGIKEESIYYYPIVEKLLSQIFTPNKSPNLSENISFESVLEGTVPAGSLLSIFAFQLAELHGINSMCLLWVEFLKKLRDYWRNCIFIPELGQCLDYNQAGGGRVAYRTSTPDLKQSLLHQKLQLLNCCIEKRLIEIQEEEDEEEDEIFFDSHETTAISSTEKSPSLGVKKPEGVLRIWDGEMSLAPGIKKQLNLPKTQRSLPRTQDMIDEQQVLLKRLGDDSKETAIIRRRLQDESLISDMQAFKAANPGCCFGDFVRWYSPFDWLAWEDLSNEEQQFMNREESKIQWFFHEKGILSERLQASIRNSGKQLPLSCSDLMVENWLELDVEDSGVCIAKQKCLFNSKKEAEKIFHQYGDLISPVELITHILLAHIGNIATFFFTEKDDDVSNNTRINLPLNLEEKFYVVAKQTIASLNDAIALAQERSCEENKILQDRCVVGFALACDNLEKLLSVCVELETFFELAKNLAIFFSSHLEPPAENMDDFTTSQYTLISHLLVTTQTTRSSYCIQSQLERDFIQQVFFLQQDTENSVRTKRTYILRCLSPKHFQTVNSNFLDEEEEFADFCRDENEYYASLKMKSMDKADCLEIGTQKKLESFSPLLVISRMFAEFDDVEHTVRFAMALADSEF